MHHFYNGLTETTRMLLNASAGGALMNKSANYGYQLLENMTLKNFQWPSDMVTPKKSIGVHELDVFNNLIVQVSLLIKKHQSTQLQNA